MNALGNIATGIGSIGEALVGAFDNGINIYAGVKERIEAFKKIDEETVKEEAKAVAVPSAEVTDAQRQGRLTAFGLGAVLILGIVLINRVMGSKKG